MINFQFFIFVHHRVNLRIFMISQVMRLFLQTYNEEAIQSIIEPLKLQEQGIRNRDSIRSHLIMLEHQVIFKELGLNIKQREYTAFKKLPDKKEKFLEMIDAASLDVQAQRLKIIQ